MLADFTMTEATVESLTTNLGCLLFVLLFMYGYTKLIPAVERWLVRRQAQTMRKADKTNG